MDECAMESQPLTRRAAVAADMAAELGIGAATVDNLLTIIESAQPSANDVPSVSYGKDQPSHHQHLLERVAIYRQVLEQVQTKRQHLSAVANKKQTDLLNALKLQAALLGGLLHRQQRDSQQRARNDRIRHLITRTPTGKPIPLWKQALLNNGRVLLLALSLCFMIAAFLLTPLLLAPLLKPLIASGSAVSATTVIADVSSSGLLVCSAVFMALFVVSFVSYLLCQFYLTNKRTGFDVGALDELTSTLHTIVSDHTKLLAAAISQYLLLQNVNAKCHRIFALSSAMSADF